MSKRRGEANDFAAIVEAPTTFDAVESITLRLRRAEYLVRRRLAPTLDSYGLHLEHWQILAVLLAQPGLRMSDLAEAAVLPPASLTRHVDKLVERALVIRRIDPKDKRSQVVALSAMGRSVADGLAVLERGVAIETGVLPASPTALSVTT